MKTNNGDDLEFVAYQAGLAAQGSTREWCEECHGQHNSICGCNCHKHAPVSGEAPRGELVSDCCGEIAD